MLGLLLGGGSRDNGAKLYSEHNEKEALCCGSHLLYHRFFHFTLIPTFLNPSTKQTPFRDRNSKWKGKFNY